MQVETNPNMQAGYALFVCYFCVETNCCKKHSTKKRISIRVLERVFHLKKIISSIQSGPLIKFLLCSFLSIVIGCANQSAPNQHYINLRGIFICRLDPGICSSQRVSTNIFNHVSYSKMCPSCELDWNQRPNDQENIRRQSI